MKSKVSLKKSKLACTDPIGVGYTFLLEYKDAICAQVMHCSPGVARNKLNPDCETNHQTLENAVALSQELDDDRQLEAWAALRGKAMFDLPQGSVSDDELTDQILLVAENFGNISEELRQARKDGIIDPEERNAIQRRVMAMVSSLMNLDAEVASQVRQFPTKIKSA
ncbi:conserved hypothetical protein [Paraglaciecola sp. T6c]|uniref:phage regulatory CII family protein n=1 Tax=Pseudoalteromonas atlantica (strain T6c / ATCC BAA-1087) TaxID=3042615 RepID=UPI00005C6021|nr:phage regulatory CII family protein [Paraglaciecola sp. T6c]ABG39207.1 conserved hypothetical protein [Paraglaciecola sp. T6c]